MTDQFEEMAKGCPWRGTGTLTYCEILWSMGRDDYNCFEENCALWSIHKKLLALEKRVEGLEGG